MFTPVIDYITNGRCMSTPLIWLVQFRYWVTVPVLYVDAYAAIEFLYVHNF